MNGSLELNTTPDNVQTVAPSIGKKRRNPAKRGLTQEEVRRELDYNPKTGELRWKVWKLGRRRANELAGSSRPDGYRVVSMKGTQFLAHRVIWLWWYGYWPENSIDHIDKKPSNNRLINLREVTHTCNMRNCKKRKSNSSGVVGIGWDKRYNKWTVTIDMAYRSKSLGYHTDFAEAVAHRLAAEQCLDWAGCDNNSSAYQYMQNYIRR